MCASSGFTSGAAGRSISSALTRRPVPVSIAGPKCLTQHTKAIIGERNAAPPPLAANGAATGPEPKTFSSCPAAANCPARDEPCSLLGDRLTQPPTIWHWRPDHSRKVSQREPAKCEYRRHGPRKCQWTHPSLCCFHAHTCSTPPPQYEPHLEISTAKNTLFVTRREHPASGLTSH